MDSPGSPGINFESLKQLASLGSFGASSSACVSESCTGKGVGDGDVDKALLSSCVVLMRVSVSGVAAVATLAKLVVGCPIAVLEQ